MSCVCVLVLAFFSPHVLIKACLAALEISTVSVENDLLCLQEKTKLQENIVEDCKNQVNSILKCSNISFKSINSFE